MVKVAVLCALLAAVRALAAESTTTAAQAINSLGVDLLARAARPDQNALLSPYSIQSALAMTYAGAEGVTRAEMAKVLHFPKDQAELDRSFAAMRKALDDVAKESAGIAERMKKSGATNDPITLTVANRLFGQAGYNFRAPFLAQVKDNYGAPFEPLDFSRDAAGATKHINVWVEDQTRQRIRNLIPNGVLNPLTRLLLVNAIYLKAPWAEEFNESATKPLPFHVAGGNSVDVPTMTQEHSFGYTKGNGFSVVVLPYMGGEIQFLVFLPDNVNGLAVLERKLTPGLLAESANLRGQQMILYLPKFKLEPPLFALADELKVLGMKNAFDQPRGSANFELIAPRRPDDYLYLSEVFHKTFLSLDEKGTEAAAATAIHMMTLGIHEPAKPIEVKVDHPFLFAVQHRSSGACLFLGRMVDPR